jgi:predicted MFS family arabinose efflux permease
MTKNRLGRDFGWLWAAQASSLTGAQISELALPLLAVLVLDASAGELGLVGVARWLPFLVLALPLGVMVDRLRRRGLMILSDYARAAVTLVLVGLALAGLLSFPALLVLVLVLGAFTVLFEVSYQSFLPAVAHRDRLEVANGRLQATAAAAEVGGPGLGGFLVQFFAAPIALLVHGVAYLASAVALGQIRTAEEKPAPSARSFAADLREGVRFVVADKYLLSLTGFSAIYNLFSQWIMVLFTIHAIRTLGLTPGELGIILSVGAVGALAAVTFATRLTRWLGAGPALVWCVVVECVAIGSIPLIGVNWPTAVIITVLATAFAFNGAGTALSSVISLTLRQLRTPDRLLGRVNASMRWISYGSVAIGAASGGLVGELTGVFTGLTVGCAGIFLSVIWVVASPLRVIRSPQSIATHAGTTSVTTPTNNAVEGAER